MLTMTWTIGVDGCAHARWRNKPADEEYAFATVCAAAMTFEKCRLVNPRGSRLGLNALRGRVQSRK